MQDDDTIAALSTPEGAGAIAIVRLSGTACDELCNSTLGLKPVYRQARYASYTDSKGTKIDSLIAVSYAKGASYTGESMLELSCHGNPLIAKNLLDDLQARGCRLAEPGEFTKRAFLNGKIDLSQAEAVAELIDAKSDRALESAHRQLAGGLSDKINNLINRLLEIIAEIEAYIDFPEEDIPRETPDTPIAKLLSIKEEMLSLIETRKCHSAIHKGLRAVLCGLPNAGKSSLLNALLGEERAIVSPEPGTTRDFVSETINIAGFPIEIIDTAGLRQSDSEIEQEGVRRSEEHIKHSDCILYILDSSSDSPSVNKKWEEMFHVEHLLVIENKSDLDNSQNCQHIFPEAPHIRLSATTGEGMDALKEEWAKLLTHQYPNRSDSEITVNSRHATALESAVKHIGQVTDNTSDMPSELQVSELKSALEQLGSICGKVDNEDMLDILFSRFCIGK